MSKLIGIDWDDTYTADPELWDQFIAIAKERGHRIVFVSCRTDEWAAEDPMEPPCGSLVVLTNLCPKRPHMEKLGLPVDIWIDDCPESVKEGR